MKAGIRNLACLILTHPGGDPNASGKGEEVTPGILVLLILPGRSLDEEDAIRPSLVCNLYTSNGNDKMTHDGSHLLFTMHC